jgi:hypothetical protein
MPLQLKIFYRSSSYAHWKKEMTLFARRTYRRRLDCALPGRTKLLRKIIDTVLPVTLCTTSSPPGRTEVVHNMVEGGADVERGQSAHMHEFSERCKITAAGRTIGSYLVDTLRALFCVKSQSEYSGRGFADIGWRRNDEFHRDVVGSALVSTYGPRQSTSLERPRERFLPRVVIRFRAGKLRATKETKIICYIT